MESKNEKESKLEMFERIYAQKIKLGAWITKDDMAQKGFFPKENTNGRDIRFIKKKYELEIQKEGTKEKMFRIIGEKTSLSNPERLISSEIRKTLSKRPCVFTGTYSNIEIDHKNGRYNDERVLDPETQTIDDFQPLTKIVNNIKREACKKCLETNKKFDAKTLGYEISTLDGEMVHDNTPDGCKGCFFYDILMFKKKYNESLCTCENCQGKCTFSEEKFYENFKKNNLK